MAIEQLVRRSKSVIRATVTRGKFPDDGNLNNLPAVDISFGTFHVNTATQWRIVDPSVWQFEDGKALMLPQKGTIS